MLRAGGLVHGDLQSRRIIAAGAICMLLGVCAGAFGAHALKAALPQNLLNAYQTGVQYQIYHALGLMVLGLLMQRLPPSRWLYWSGIAMFTGIVLFSGSLYTLALSGIKTFGLITPIGGLFLIVSWLLLALGILKSNS
jgi:uncharacterized membrane protein YgdD (TMEM256/DUF423 family)